jgi:UDP-N-acetylmuramoyl-L-alanyl-D-glutamate--2,6-diaminopimelate ligase
MGTLGLLAEGFPKDKNLTTENPIALHRKFSELKKAGFTHIVMEVSSHALQQYRVTDVDFNYAIFTNLTPEHLDYHHTMEEYSYAKSKLFKGLPLDATAIINMDDQFGESIKNDCTCPVLSFSQSSKEDAHYLDYDISVEGIKATIGIGETQYKIKSYLTGKFNLENILASVALAHVAGIDAQYIEDGISDCSYIPGRMEVITLMSGGKAIIDYAHTPDAYEKTISTIRELMVSNGNLTIVFGAGGERDRTKRPLMGAIVDQYANMSYVVPDNPRSEKLADINSQIVAGYTSNNYKIFNDRGEGLKAALRDCQENDVVVVLGKGREESQEIDRVRHFYSDFKIIEEFVK